MEKNYVLYVYSIGILRQTRLALLIILGVNQPLQESSVLVSMKAPLPL